MAELSRLIAGVQPVAVPSLEGQLAGTWKFGRVGGALLCNVTLTLTPGQHGYVLSACHANESFWKLDGQDLLFLHADGAVTSRLSRVDAQYWDGPYIPHPLTPCNGPCPRHYISRR